MSPFLYMVSTSLMTLGETINRRLLPATPQWVNYRTARSDADLALYFRNSGLITALVILGVLVLCTLAGYAFAHPLPRPRDDLPRAAGDADDPRHRDVPAELPDGQGRGDPV